MSELKNDGWLQSYMSTSIDQSANQFSGVEKKDAYVP